MQNDAISSTRYVGFRERPSTPQLGDDVTIYIQATDASDDIFVTLLASNPDSPFGTSLQVRCNFNDDNFGFRESTESGNTNTDVFADLSSYLNETLRIEVTLQQNRTASGEVYVDSTDTLLADLEITIDDVISNSGDVVYACYNGSTTTTVYFDGPFITRRTREYLTDTAKGTTELGNEVTPSGAINTGPQEVLDADAVLADIAVSPDVSQGTPVGGTITLNQDPAFSVKGEADGSGGIQNAKVVSSLPLETDSATINNYGVRANLSSVQTISASTDTKLQFDTAQYNDEGILDTANYQITVPEDGRYLISIRLRLVNNVYSGDGFILRVRRNSDTISLSQDRLQGNFESVELTEQMRLNQGDVMEVYLENQGSTSVDVRDQVFDTYFALGRVA